MHRGLGLVVVTLGVALSWHGALGQSPGTEPVHRGRTLAEWRQDLGSGTPAIRERAVMALCDMGEPAVPPLIEAVSDWDFNVRTAAIFCLGRLGPRAQEAVPVLVRTLDDRDWIVRRYAAGALGLLGSTAAEAGSALTRAAVVDSRPEVRETAVAALGRLGRAAAPAITPVLEQLRDTGADEAVRQRAADLLRDMAKE